MEARFEMGEVLLTARILDILRQFHIREMARYFATTHKVSESIAGSSSKFARLAERQNALRIKRDGKLSAETGFHLWLRQAQAAGDGLRYIEV